MWPLKRKKKSSNAAARAYAGASYDRLVAGWIAASSSVDAEIKGSRRKLVDRSRQLGRDNDYVRGFYRSVENNVVGLGIPFQAQVKKLRGQDLDENTNRMIEEAFDRWTRKENCHVAGQLSWRDIQRLAIRSTAESGDFYVRMIKQKFGSSKVPFALELIESDQLDEDLNDAQRNIKMGVERDSWSRPIAYWFLDKHPGELGATLSKASAKWRRIPADEIIPLFITERAGQTRGVPWIASSIVRLHHMQGYQEAEVIAARASASQMGFIESEIGEVQGDDVEAGDRVTDFEPGIFKLLAPGQKVNIPNMNRPSGEFDPFMRAMLRGVCSGLGVAYHNLSSDSSQSNYSSSRIDLLSERDNWRAIQSWFRDNFLQIVFENWLNMAVLSGELKLANYELNPERYTRVRWMPRGWAWVDPAKEVAAYREAIAGGLSTQTKVLAMEGEDINEVMAERAREVGLAKKLGLVFDTNAAHELAQTAAGSGPASPDDT